MPNQTNNPTELIESIQSLRVENARLIALLQSHGIDGQLANNFDGSVTPNASDEVGDSGIPGHLAAKSAAGISNADKIALFRRLFRGRTDVYSLRWESKKRVIRVMHQHAPTNGVPGFAISRALSVVTVTGAN
jgi:hypothetical protein